VSQSESFALSRDRNEAGPRSAEAFARAKAVFPDGTARVTVERDPIPRYMHHGEGAYLVDIDGRRFLDLNGNFTTLIHGHAFPPVVAALTRQLQNGSCFANPTEVEIELAELLCARVPHLERMRFVNSGTEAVMFAVKAARAFTGRPAIAKIEGAYHGAYDWVEVSQAATPTNWGDPNVPASTATYRGMPTRVLEDVVVLRFNDVDGAVRLLNQHGERLAAVVIDPMPSRGGLIAPTTAFVDALQATARRLGILIISDEVLNLRQGYAGASVRYGLTPDLFALGKIIGGGLPIGAVGGRQEIMSVFDADKGPPFLPQGGTFSANPLSMTAGLVAMQALDRAAFTRLEQLGDDVRAKLEASIASHGAPLSVTGAASLFRIHPKRRPPREFREAYPGSAEIGVMTELTRFFAANGIVLPFGAAACLSTPMGRQEIELVGHVFDGFLSERASVFE
jgi:glutamate-1-semialdehyde 2,1-aminomutase